MINDVVIVGKLVDLKNDDYRHYLKVEVDRPFNEKDGIRKDYIECKIWTCIFNDIKCNCNTGDLVAVRGRLESEENNYYISSERVVILNKSKETILKVS